MRARVLLSLVTGITFLFTVSTQDLRAAASNDLCPRGQLHTMTSLDLHSAVRTSSAERVAALKSVQDFLARSEVQSKVLRMGLDPATVSARASLLSDSEILALQTQVMAADEQIRTAGMIGWVIVLIIVLVVLGVLIILAAVGVARAAE